MWGIDHKLWANLQERGHLDAIGVRNNKSGRKAGRYSERLVMDVIQAASFGVQLALIREVGLTNADAMRLALQAKEEIEKLFATPGPIGSKTILYALTTGKDNPEWIPVNKDTFVVSVDQSLKGRPWIVIDVMHYVAEVSAYVIARTDPEGYAKWKAKKQAEKN
jgi:hypothetical protein